MKVNKTFRKKLIKLKFNQFKKIHKRCINQFVLHLKKARQIIKKYKKRI